MSIPSFKFFRVASWLLLCYVVDMATKKKPKADGVKDDVVRFRITLDEKKLLTSVAEEDDLTLSSWVRRLALQEARRRKAAK